MTEGGAMSITIVLEIAKLALEIAKLALAMAARQKDWNVQNDTFFEEKLLEIIRKAVRAYRDHTGEPPDPALLEAQDPA
jgi:hypothetical protein